MNQSHAPAIWRESAGSGAVPSVGALRLVLLAPGVYGLIETGAPAAAFVEASLGVVTIDTTRTAGDLSAVRIGTKGVLY